MKTERLARTEFEHKQLVKRSPDMVPCVIIGGKIARQDNPFAEEFGRKKFGHRLAPLDADRGLRGL